MKKQVLAAALSVAMAGCIAGMNVSAAEAPYHVGICQLVQHDALDAATQGFKDALVEEFGEDGVEFDEQNAQGDSNTCSTIVNSFVSNNVDLILANATPALQAAVAATDTIPILGTSVPSTVWRLALRTSTEPSAPMFPVLPILLRWTSRQPC